MLPRMFVPDPFIYLRIRGRHILVMSDLEIDRAKKQAAHCRVLSLSQCQQKLRRAGTEKATVPPRSSASSCANIALTKFLFPAIFPSASRWNSAISA